MNRLSCKTNSVMIKVAKILDSNQFKSFKISQEVVYALTWLSSFTINPF